MCDHYRLNVRLSADDPQDAVVIRALERLGDRGKSRWVRRILYEAVTGPARDELLSEIRAVRDVVERLETNGAPVTAKADAGAEPDAEPAKARAGLDAMLQRFTVGDQ